VIFFEPQAEQRNSVIGCGIALPNINYFYEDEHGKLDVGSDRRLYWNDEPVRTGFALTRWQKFWATVVGIAAVLDPRRLNAT
jgi:hypothetical protein